MGGKPGYRRGQKPERRIRKALNPVDRRESIVTSKILERIYEHKTEINGIISKHLMDQDPDRHNNLAIELCNYSRTHVLDISIIEDVFFGDLQNQDQIETRRRIRAYATSQRPKQ